MRPDKKKMIDLIKIERRVQRDKPRLISLNQVVHAASIDIPKPMRCLKGLSKQAFISDAYNF